MESKKFHLGDLLTVATSKLLSPDGMSGVYHILNFMTQDSIFTHQIPRCLEECKPYILEQHPFLKNIVTDGVNRYNYQQWMEGLLDHYGEYYMVYPIHQEDHATIDPIEEFEQRHPDKEYIAIDIDHGPIQE